MPIFTIFMMVALPLFLAYHPWGSKLWAIEPEMYRYNLCGHNRLLYSWFNWIKIELSRSPVERRGRPAKSGRMI